MARRRVGARVSTISEEVIFGRSSVWKVFVSSKMRGGTLDAERRAAIAAIDSMSIAAAWAWEKDAQPGAYCAEGLCVGHARTSDVLILILGSDLTPTTEKEYHAAAEAQAQRIILVKDGVRRRRAAKDFLESERATVATTKNFQNLSELRSHIIEALKCHAVQSSRHAQLARLNAVERRHHFLDRVWRSR